jgi:hypothetical protein
MKWKGERVEMLVELMAIQDREGSQKIDLQIGGKSRWPHF